MTCNLTSQSVSLNHCSASSSMSLSKGNWRWGKDKFQLWPDLQKQKGEVNASNNPLTEHLSGFTLSIHISSPFPSPCMGNGKSPAHQERDPGRNPAAGNSFHIAYCSRVEEPHVPRLWIWGTSNLWQSSRTGYWTEAGIAKITSTTISLTHLTNFKSHVFLKQLYIIIFINKHF